jgi:hypothetical protein
MILVVVEQQPGGRDVVGGTGRAAQTIGGLPVTHNFVDAGRTTSSCTGPASIALQPDGEPRSWRRRHR